MPIGFTSADIANGMQIRAMQLTSENLKMMGALHAQLGALAAAANGGLLVMKPLEVYFLDSFIGLDDETFEKLYGRKYMVVDYYNEAAFDLSRQFNIKLPPVIAKLTRAELPKNLGISMKAITYVLPH